MKQAVWKMILKSSTQEINLIQNNSFSVSNYFYFSLNTPFILSETCHDHFVGVLYTKLSDCIWGNDCSSLSTHKNKFTSSSKDFLRVNLDVQYSTAWHQNNLGKFTQSSQHKFDIIMLKMHVTMDKNTHKQLDKDTCPEFISFPFCPDKHSPVGCSLLSFHWGSVGQRNLIRV